MINPFKDCAKRGWASLLLQGAIATYQPTEDLNDLKKELVAFFWRIIDDCGCGAAALEMILQSYDSFDLTEPMDGELPLKRVKTNYKGQLGTAALHMLLTNYKVRSHEQAEFEVAVRDKAAWLLKHGADPVDKFHHPAKFAALPCFLARLNMTTRLTTMPPEILLAIADLLPQAALHALALANKRLYDVINPVLYAKYVKNEAPDITVLAARD
ncbi:hypothetical protein K4K61_001932 [Colletotrichum sp. SAR11_59]|nr:hypothetical protein K4K61_001932 [Colletotrichum sp. SAR11_59]